MPRLDAGAEDLHPARGDRPGDEGGDDGAHNYSKTAKNYRCLCQNYYPSFTSMSRVGAHPDPRARRGRRLRRLRRPGPPQARLRGTIHKQVSVKFKPALSMVYVGQATKDKIKT